VSHLVSHLMQIKTPRLVKNRLGTYYFRVKENGVERKFSLRTKCPTAAAILALQINVEIEKQRRGTMSNNPKLSDLNLNFDAIRKYEVEVKDGGYRIKADGPEDHARALEAMRALAALKPDPQPRSKPLDQRIGEAISANAAARVPAKKLSEVLALYLIQKEATTTLRSRKDKKSATDAFVARLGDLPVDEYTPENAVDHKNVLIAKKLSITRINQILGIVREVFAYAVADKLSSAPNPFDGIRIPLKKGKMKEIRESYEAFSQDEIDVIFADPAYREYMNKPGYYWVPFLAFCTGARLEEIAGLDVEDVKTEDGVQYLDILRGKNANSIRKIPLPDRVLNSAFMGYLADAKKSKEEALFPHLTGGINGRGKNMGRRFGQWLDQPEVDIVSPQKVFHSFRHTFINRMTELNVNPFFLMALVGHYEQDKVDFSSSHNQVYQHGKSLKALKQLIDQFDFTLPHAF
jgi:integrase